MPLPAIAAVALRLLLWLGRKYGWYIAGTLLVWLGIELGEELLEGAAEEVGADAVRLIKQGNADAKAKKAHGTDPVGAVDRSIIAEVLAHLAPLRQDESTPPEWDNPYDEPEQLARDELCAWERLENADPCA